MEESMQTPAPLPTPTAAPAPAASSDTVVPVPTPPANPNAKSILLVVTYLIPIAFIYTMIKKGDKPFFVWHSKNAAAYLLVAVGLNIIFQILWTIIPGFAGIFSMVMNLAYLLLFVGVVYFGIVKGSWEGKQTAIPVLTNIGQKLPLEKWFNTATKAASTPSSASSSASPAAPSAPTAPATPEAPAASAEPTMPAAPANEQTPPTPPATPAA